VDNISPYEFSNEEAEQFAHFIASDLGQTILARINQLEDFTERSILNLLKSTTLLEDDKLHYLQGILQGFRLVTSVFDVAVQLHETNLENKGVKT